MQTEMQTGNSEIARFQNGAQPRLGKDYLFVLHSAHALVTCRERILSDSQMCLAETLQCSDYGMVPPFCSCPGVQLEKTASKVERQKMWSLERKKARTNLKM